MAGMINQPNTHQIEALAEDTLPGLSAPPCRDGTATGRVVVVALPCNQSPFSRRKKSSGQLIEGGSRRGLKTKRKGKELYDENAIVDEDDEILPFQKNNLLWEAAESLEAFKSLPQKPHFRPLESCREIQREGKALSLMVLFDKITKKTVNLQFDAPKEDIENDLSLLSELETHGFDVMKLRDILTGLLSLKDAQEDTENLLKENKMRLTEFDHEKLTAKEIRIKIQDDMKKVMTKDRSYALREIFFEDDAACDQLELRKLEAEYTKISKELQDLVASPLY